MTGPGRRFDPAELRGDGGAPMSEAETAEVIAAARELEALAARDRISPTTGFEDRVMAAIAKEAPPKLVVPAASGPFRRVGVFIASVGEAWRVATSGGRPVAIRAQAMAFVLLVVLATGSLASVAAIGAANVLLSPPGPTHPAVPIRTAEPTPTGPTEPVPTVGPEDTQTQTPASTPSPTETSEPGETESPGETDEAAETPEPTETPEPRTPKPTAKSETPRPPRTPRPTETPEPKETPEPTETPEH